jgi:hypothetical protein
MSQEVPSEGLLMVRRMLGNQVMEEDTTQKRKYFPNKMSSTRKGMCFNY